MYIQSCQLFPIRYYGNDQIYLSKDTLQVYGNKAYELNEGHMGDSMVTYQYHKKQRWQKGNHPCPVLVGWELLLIRLEWPMTEQTESCLFSDSVGESGKTQKVRETGEV